MRRSSGGTTRDTSKTLEPRISVPAHVLPRGGAAPGALRVDRRRARVVPVRREDSPGPSRNRDGGGGTPGRRQRGLVGGGIRRHASPPRGRQAAGTCRSRSRPSSRRSSTAPAGSRARGRARTSTPATSRSRASRRRERCATGRRRPPSRARAWFDHEWGPGVLPQEAQGWDWFALQLDDGSDLMLYRMRARERRRDAVLRGHVRSGRRRAADHRLARRHAGGNRRLEVSPLGRPLSRPMDARRRVAGPGRDPRALVPGPGARHRAVHRGHLLGRRVPRKGHAPGTPVAGRAYAELTGYARRDVPGFAGPKLPVAAHCGVGVGLGLGFDPRSRASRVTVKVFALARLR